jgi:hypothetical protein
LEKEIIKKLKNQCVFLLIQATAIPAGMHETRINPVLEFSGTGCAEMLSIAL